nr:MAG TPA: hypothetical protein [Ackermannviridae sp.]
MQQSIFTLVTHTLYHTKRKASKVAAPDASAKPYNQHD